MPQAEAPAETWERTPAPRKTVLATRQSVRSEPPPAPRLRTRPHRWTSAQAWGGAEGTLPARLPAQGPRGLNALPARRRRRAARDRPCAGGSRAVLVARHGAAKLPSWPPAPPCGHGHPPTNAPTPHTTPRRPTGPAPGSDGGHSSARPGDRAQERVAGCLGRPLSGHGLRGAPSNSRRPSVPAVPPGTVVTAKASLAHSRRGRSLSAEWAPGLVGARGVDGRTASGHVHTWALRPP